LDSEDEAAAAAPLLVVLPTALDPDALDTFAVLRVDSTLEVGIL